ncbi:uncharacterized protein KGF55_003573 [Candida pseudojiufengensis]|uniref:uncharacterized protein n=1 Tax=Candida pseudojiufengensis TaxID=497109 RepID=UPI002224B505|nr:uncharacterized protein KGF55_003573 [Candida pseudojiufengensis]KAI5962497.1 hypothetical protein KGF55_003573 [Candida pseudojiufengensis]
MVEQAYYKKGYQQSVSNTHAWRTVENSGKFITAVLQPDFKVLDAGSGPGTITIDFAKNYLNDGSIVGIEPTQQLIDESNELKLKQNVSNAKFKLGSIYNIPFPDNTFDLVYSHQVIIHLEDPIKALKELERVTKPGGFVCVKDADLEATVVSPKKYEILKEYSLLKAKNSGSTDPIAGRNLRSKAIQAGYDPNNITSSISQWLLTDDLNEKQKFADMFIGRVKTSNEVAYTDEQKNEEIKNKVVEAYKEWAEDVNSLFCIINFEITYQK